MLTIIILNYLNNLFKIKVIIVSRRVGNGTRTGSALPPPSPPYIILNNNEILVTQFISISIQVN